MKKQLFISLSLVLAGCGQQQAVINRDSPTGKEGSSSSVSHAAAADKASSQKKTADSKPEDLKSFTDSRDGKQYKMVTIGTQTWMAENLNYNVVGSSKCYDNKSANCDKYGRLYSWSAAAKSGCPKGWHLPSNAEWDVLYRSADGASSADSPYQSDVSGKYLKTKGGWSQGGNGEDKFGFSAMPGGFGNPDGYFNFIGSNGVWWSSSEYDAYYAYNRHLIYIDEGAHWSYNDKSNLFSVRCIQN